MSGEDSATRRDVTTATTAAITAISVPSHVSHSPGPAVQLCWNVLSEPPDVDSTRERAQMACPKA